MIKPPLCWLICDPQVDPGPYYHACVQESCSCEFEGKFLGFCTAVAAYAEACSDQDVCVKWRTPDLCRKFRPSFLPRISFTERLELSFQKINSNSKQAAHTRQHFNKTFSQLHAMHTRHAILLLSV